MYEQKGPPSVHALTSLPSLYVGGPCSVQSAGIFLPLDINEYNRRQNRTCVPNLLGVLPRQESIMPIRIRYDGGMPPFLLLLASYWLRSCLWEFHFWNGEQRRLSCSTFFGGTNSLTWAVTSNLALSRQAHKERGGSTVCSTYEHVLSNGRSFFAS